MAMWWGFTAELDRLKARQELPQKQHLSLVIKIRFHIFIIQIKFCQSSWNIYYTSDHHHLYPRHTVKEIINNFKSMWLCTHIDCERQSSQAHNLCVSQINFKREPNFPRSVHEATTQVRNFKKRLPRQSMRHQTVQKYH